MKHVLASMLLLTVSCSDTRYHKDSEQWERQVMQWSSPAFSGTVNHIKSLEDHSAKRDEWRNSSKIGVTEKIISSQAELLKALTSVNFRPWLKDYAVKLYQNSACSALYEFPGTYRILVFFNEEGHSTEEIRDP